MFSSRTAGRHYLLVKCAANESEPTDLPNMQNKKTVDLFPRYDYTTMHVLFNRNGALLMCTQCEFSPVYGSKWPAHDLCNVQFGGCNHVHEQG